MKILDNSDKFLLRVIPRIVTEKLGAETAGIKFIGGGSFGRVYAVTLVSSQVIAVKAYRVQGSQHDEAQQLSILAENTDVKMPQVLFTYEDEDTAILGMTFVEGKNALDPMFLFKSKKQKNKFADSVIDGMLKWHSVTNDKFGSLTDAHYDTWIEYYKKEKQEPWLKALGELADKGKFSLKKLELLQKATEIFNSNYNENSTPVLIHADLNIMNIMADPKTMILTAFIDPCGAMWADREYDLFQFRNMWGDAFGLYEAYKKKTGLGDDADFRVAYYGAMHEASMRLKGGLIVPVWEDLDMKRLKKEMKKL